MPHVIITGASSGIGRSLTTLLIDKGYQVTALCRTECPQFDHPAVQHIPTDLRQTDSIRQALGSIPTADALVNSAGVAYQSPALSGDVADWDEMWEVNVRALALCSQLAIPLFPAAGGQVISLSSMSGHRVPPSGGVYAPTKFAVRALCESLRLELRAAGNPTRITTVSPGFVDTPMLDVYFRDRPAAQESAREQGMMLQPADIAAQVLHILETPLHVEIGDLSLRSSQQAV